MARKSRERKQRKPRLASPHAVNLALARADGILSRSKKLGTMKVSENGIAIQPESEAQPQSEPKSDDDEPFIDLGYHPPALLELEELRKKRGTDTSKRKRD